MRRVLESLCSTTHAVETRCGMSGTFSGLVLKSLLKHLESLAIRRCPPARWQAIIYGWSLVNNCQESGLLRTQHLPGRNSDAIQAIANLVILPIMVSV